MDHNIGALESQPTTGLPVWTKVAAHWRGRLRAHTWCLFTLFGWGVRGISKRCHARGEVYWRASPLPTKLITGWVVWAATRS